MKIIFIITEVLILVILIQACKKEEDKPKLPVVSTTAITEITRTSANSGGNITNDGGAEIISRGVCWGTSTNPTVSGSKTTDGTGKGSFASSIMGLEANTLYYVKAYATNSVGTAYGNEISFNTLELRDADGNIYTTIAIGSQLWMVENLKTTKYNDEIQIPNETDNQAWISLITPAYCWYNNDINNKDTYGALYNWYTVNTNKLCPAGWHVPTVEEWTIMESFLGESEAGGKIKSVGTIEDGNGLWRSPNLGANNSSGFSAVPSGRRYYVTGEFENLGYFSYWWSSTASGDLSSAGASAAVYSEKIMYRGFTQLWSGYSVRCIQDY